MKRCSIWSRMLLAKRCTKSKTRGRPATPAEVVLRVLLLKHMRNWSYQELAREVRANLVYREFTRIGGGKVPDDKTMGRLGRQLGPEVIQKVHERVVAIAQRRRWSVAGRCAWTPPWWRPTFTIQPTAAYWEMGRAC